MQFKKEVTKVLLTATILLGVPLLASRFVDGWAWSPSDYVFAWVMFAGTGLFYKFIVSRSCNFMYRAGAALAIAAGFMIIWGNLAVGFIGSEDNPINLLYFAVLAISFFSAIAVRFQAKGLERVMYATALGMAWVPVIALVAGSTFAEIPEAAGTVAVFGFNMVFVAMFVGSGMLFRNAGIDGAGQMLEAN
jgi:hypothetical protein